MNNDDNTRDTSPPFWCSLCSKDLQSQAALSEHEKGRKHCKKAFQLDPANSAFKKRPPSFDALAPLGEDEFFQNLATGTYQNIVVLTGAGISTAAGVPDYRSGGGFFDKMLKEYSDRFPEVNGSPEVLFSRAFANRHPTAWRDEILPMKQSFFKDLQPTKAHRFCAHLHKQGWLKRIYTQNVDGLHLHSSLEIPDDKVMECHGSMNKPDTLVLYGDALSPRFAHQASLDFDLNPKDPHQKVDLVIVMGTSLQVAPFCGLPNMTPRGATRVLVNRRIDHCLHNSFGGGKRGAREGLWVSNTMTIGSRKNVKLQPLWTGREARKRWRQLLLESDCDAFVRQCCNQARLEV